MLRFTVPVVLAALACCSPISQAATNILQPGDILFQTSVSGSNLASYRPGGLQRPLIATLPSTTTTGLAVDPFGIAYVPTIELAGNQRGQIYRVNLVTGDFAPLSERVELGSTLGPVGIAYEPRGTLITSGFQQERLQRVNPFNGLSSTFVTAPAGFRFQGAAVDNQGRIYTAELGTNTTGVRFVRFDPDTGARTLLLSTTPVSVIDGLAVSPSGDRVFASSRSVNRVFRLDVGTGLLQSFPAASSEPVGLAVGANGLLYFGATGAGGPELRSLDVNNGTANVVARGLSINGRLYGVAAVPVPAPGAGALVTLAALALTRRRR